MCRASLSVSLTASYERGRFFGLDRVFLRPSKRGLLSAIQDLGNLMVSTISLCEVVRYITRTANREAALEAAAQMQ
jgi:hypothetical protein